MILLDVVAQGPGPVADVTLRFKNVTRLGNGVAHAHLSLAEGAVAQGPAERNVVRNLLAHDFAARLRLLASQLRAGHDDAVRAEIELHQRRPARLAGEIVDLAGDAALAANTRFLGELRQLIDSGALRGAEACERAAQSLRYAAFTELHTAVAGAPCEEDAR